MIPKVVYLALGAAILGLLFGFGLLRWVLKHEKGTQRMQEISLAIQEGANAFLAREYKTVGKVAIPFFLFFTFALPAIKMHGEQSYTYLLAHGGWQTGVSFLVGLGFSMLAGFIGMTLTTRANTRLAWKAREGVPKALPLAFRSGAVTGMMVGSLALLGLVIFLLGFEDPVQMVGYAFGASLLSLFARIGGGIYTKSADLGADMVGKVEKGIPEDDPRNPAVIADQVGDNVGDCAGMAADLFETYAVTALGTMLIGWFLFERGMAYVVYPLLLGAAGIIATIAGIFAVRMREGEGIMAGIYRGIAVTAVVALALYAVITKAYMSEHLAGVPLGGMGLFIAALIGILIAFTLFFLTDYWTSKSFGPVRSIAKASTTGPATNLVMGLSVGYMSSAAPALVICAGILTAFCAAGGAAFFADTSNVTALYNGFYGIGVAVMGMIALTGMVIATDSYGPVTDNAAGIAEMAGLPEDVRKNTDALDAVGNTTKAVTKAFAIGSAALGAITLFLAYIFETAEPAGKSVMEILREYTVWDPKVLVGLLVGALVPFAFSSRCMRSVGVGAESTIEEVRRQFREIPGIMEGTARPLYGRCVDIVTRTALRGMVVPLLLAVGTPIIVGFLLGPQALGGLLMGCIISGLFLALSLCTGGAAWDNAKKYIEEGAYGGKGSDAHKAAVVGDTVGDPCKDTAGPAINPLIKVMNTFSIIFAVAIVLHHLIPG